MRWDLAPLDTVLSTTSSLYGCNGEHHVSLEVRNGRASTQAVRAYQARDRLELGTSRHINGTC